MFDLGCVGEPDTELSLVGSLSPRRMIMHLHHNARTLGNGYADILRQPPRSRARRPAPQQSSVQDIAAGDSGQAGVAEASVSGLSVGAVQLFGLTGFVQKQQH